MTAEELLKPRFEVIADYPMSNYKVGEIIECKGNRIGTFNKDKVKYPHLFRKMNWWEKRTKEEMPKKLSLKCNEEIEIFEISHWNMENLQGLIVGQIGYCCSLLAWNPEYGYFPVD